MKPWDGGEVPCSTAGGLEEMVTQAASSFAALTF